MKVVLLSPEIHFHAPLVLRTLFSQLIPLGVEFHVFLTPKLSSAGKSWATPRNIIGVSGRRYLFLMMLMKLKYDFFRLMEKMFMRPFIKRRYLHSDEVCNEFGVRVLHLANINSEEAKTLLREIKPELIFSVFFNQILKNELLELPSLGCINLHPSFLPEYRGMSPVLWMLAEGAQTGGATLHYMSEGIDEGAVLAQERFEILPHDSFFTAYEKAALLGAKLAVELLSRSPLPPGSPQAEGGSSRGPITSEAIEALLKKRSFMRFKL